MAHEPTPGTPTKTSAADDLKAIVDKIRRGGSAPPPTTKTQNGDQIAIGMFKKSGPNWMKTGYYQTVLQYAHLYGVPAPYLAALLLQENQQADPNIANGNAVGLAQILDPTLNNYNKGKTLTWGQGNTLGTGSVITKQMKQNPVFAIAYAAWRLSGQMDTYGNFKSAYQQGYHGGTNPPDPSKFLPANYVPSKTDYSPSPLNKKIAAGPTNAVTDPYVIVDKGTGKITPTIDASDKRILEFEGFPITYSILKRQVQDKNGLGGDFYSLTGKSPTPEIVASLMASGKTVQQIENQLIDSKFFLGSPTGKKYSLSYQSAWSSIMGDNAKLPKTWGAMVKNGAKNNLDQSEFAVQVRHSPLYLQSNEYKGRVAAFSTSYENVYGTMDNNAKRLAGDAALSGWNGDQWDHYIRSQPAYTKSQEYKAHALSILDSLGLTFGFMPTLQTGTSAPTNPGTADAAPPTDKRIPGTVAPPQPRGPVAGMEVKF